VIIRHAIVEELAGLGATVHTCSRNEADLNECLSEWRKKGFKVTGSICDASSRTEREKLITIVSSIFNGKLNILVSPTASLMYMIRQHFEKFF
jgi:Tropinone reductase 1